MTTYFDVANAKVWVDESIPCIFCSITGPLGNSQLEALTEVEASCIKKLNRKYGTVYSLVNLRNCTPLMEEAIIHYVTVSIQHQFLSGLIRKLFIAPVDKLVRASLVYMLRPYEDSKVDIYDSFEEALTTINMHKDRKLEFIKPRSSFFRNLLKF